MYKRGASPLPPSAGEMKTSECKGMMKESDLSAPERRFFLHAHAPRDDVDSGGPNWYCLHVSWVKSRGKKKLKRWKRSSDLEVGNKNSCTFLYVGSCEVVGFKTPFHFPFSSPYPCQGIFFSREPTLALTGPGKFGICCKRHGEKEERSLVACRGKMIDRTRLSRACLLPPFSFPPHFVLLLTWRRDRGRTVVQYTSMLPVVDDAYCISASSHLLGNAVAVCRVA